MTCPLKINLIQKEASFERIEEKILDIRRAYLKTREGENSLFFHDSVILFYLEKVRGHKFTKYEDNAKTLHELCKSRNISIVETTREILTRREMSNIVIKGLKNYSKKVGYYADGTVSFKIRHLTVVDIAIRKEKATK